MGRLGRNPGLIPPPRPASAFQDDGALADLLRRNRESLPPGPVLVVNCPGVATAQSLIGLRRGETTDFLVRDVAIHREISSLDDPLPGKVSCLLSCWSPPDRRYAAALVFLPKGRMTAEMDLTLATVSVPSGGTVAMIGRLKEGARTAREALARLCGPLTGEDSARHARFSVSVRKIPGTPRGTLDDWRMDALAEVPGGTLKVASFPGVFSHGRIDPGTALLLGNIPADPVPRVLDFGCGSGAIGAALARAWPGSFVAMADSHSLACESARLTLRANGIGNAEVVQSDGYPEEGAKYGLIAANPPFHAGTRADYSVLRDMWNGAPGHLEPRGRLLVVLTGGIPSRVMDGRLFQRVRQLARQGPYRVIEATK